MATYELEELERLTRLLDEGRLTQAEYDRLKDRLLGSVTQRPDVTQSSMAPGWYHDPSGAAKHQTYWDGERWTGATRPGDASAVQWGHQGTKKSVSAVRVALVAIVGLAVLGLVLQLGDSSPDAVDAAADAVDRCAEESMERRFDEGIRDVFWVCAARLVPEIAATYDDAGIREIGKLICQTLGDTGGDFGAAYLAITQAFNNIGVQINLENGAVLVQSAVMLACVEPSYGGVDWNDELAAWQNS